VASDAGLLHFTHNGVLVATHAKRARTMTVRTSPVTTFIAAKRSVVP